MGFSILKEEITKRGKTLKFTPEQLKNPQVVVKKFYDFFLRGEFSFTHEELHHALKVVYKGEFISLSLKDLTEVQMKGLRRGVGSFDLDETQVYPFVFETRLTGSELGSGTLEVIEYIFADKAGYRDGLTRYSRFLGDGEAYRVLNPFRLVVLGDKSLPIRIVMDTNAFRSGEYLAWTGDKKIYQALMRYFASVLPLR